MRAHRSLASLLLVLAVGCGDDDASGPLPDSGTHDAGTPDAALDASTQDAGPVVEDAGTEPDAGPGTSGGSGGLTCERTGTAGGFEYCVVTIAGVELKVVEPTAPAPWNLGIYFHGDGARAYEGDTAVRLQAPVTEARPILYVAAKAPNGCAWWLSPDYTRCDGVIADGDIDTEGRNADAVVEVIEALRAAYDLRTDRTLFGGSSGGAVFLTGEHLPLYGADHPGLYALGCGGFEPYADFAWDPTAGSLDAYDLRFTYGDADEYRDEIEAGVEAYQLLGFPVDENVLTGGVEHCAFDHIGFVVDAWASAG